MKSDTNGIKSIAGNEFAKTVIPKNMRKKLSLQKKTVEEIHFTTEPVKSVSPIHFTENFNKTFNHIESGSFEHFEKVSSESHPLNCLICEEKNRNAVFQKCGHGGKIFIVICDVNSMKKFGMSL